MNTPIKTEIVHVTPGLATEWLKKNNINRRFRPATAAGYALLMSRGEWPLTHQGVAFAEDGTLMDGQHRLAAVVDTGCTVQMMVTWNLPKEVFSALDGGLSRTVADRTGMEPRLAEVAKLALLLSQNHHRGTVAEVRAVGDILAAGHQRLLACCTTMSKVTSSAAMRLAALVLVGEAPESADQVLDTYRALVLRHYSTLSPAAQSFIRQVETGKVANTGGPARLDVFARGLVALNPAKADTARISVKDTEGARRRLVAFLGGAL